MKIVFQLKLLNARASPQLREPDNLRTFVSSPLLRSELTMAGIGYELGFEDPSYFSRFIRRELKTSPAEFRSLIRQKYQKFMRWSQAWYLVPCFD